jgi:hypothetical protein
VRLSVQTQKTFSCVLAPQNITIEELKECMRFALANDIGFNPAFNQAEERDFKRFYTVSEKSKLRQNPQGESLRIRFR